MAVGLKPPTKLSSIAGIRLATAYAGIRKQARDDLTLIEIAATASVAASFTTNKFCAAPVQLAKTHLNHAQPQYLLVNAGNANAGTGSAGYNDAINCCEQLASLAGVKIETVLPFSTGVIAERLDVAKINKVVPSLLENLSGSEAAWLSAADAIMTTDTVAKAHSYTFMLQGLEFTVTGISKGSGMICPDMATMLSYIATDLTVPQEQLQAVHTRLVDCTFNSITVDSDTSTNDACVLIATGQGEDADVELSDEVIFEALLPVYQFLSQAVIRDGEGATKFVTVEVSSAELETDAKEVAYTIAHSPLVKTALFASDANWGRILAAIGRSKVDALDVDKIDLSINGLSLLKQGKPDERYTEEQGAKEMAKAEITISVDLNMGQAQARVWTSDLSHEYVSINADYRS